ARPCTSPTLAPATIPAPASELAPAPSLRPTRIKTPQPVPPAPSVPPEITNTERQAMSTEEATQYKVEWSRVIDWAYYRRVQDKEQDSYWR
ncbi:hypothetical protein BGX30_007979, partial [Mortierella sp. GBA39]